MFSDSPRLSLQPASGTVVTTKSGSPVCPACQSGLNRVPRRFIDRLLSIVYPVHRYHCRSFACNWEGNVRYTAELGYWDALEGASAETAGSDSAADASRSPALPAAPPPNETRPRESDTLPMPQPRTPKTKKPDARAEPRDGTNAPRRARKRAKAAPR